MKGIGAMKHECPSCGGHVEIDNYNSGGLICPHCAQEVRFTPIEEMLAPPRVPVIVKRLASDSAAEESGAGASVGGWICWSVAVLFVFIPLPTFFIYGPLFLVAFILGIVAIAQKRLASGIGLLLATIIGGPVVVGIGWVVGLIALGKAVAGK